MSIHAIAKQRRTSSCATTFGVEKHVASPFPSEQPCAHADTSQPLQAKRENERTSLLITESC